MALGVGRPRPDQNGVPVPIALNDLIRRPRPWRKPTCANENDEEVLEQLVQAAETGDVAILRTLLTDHHDLALHGDYSFAAPVSRTLLHIACIARERECVVELLKAGADANAVDENKSTPLHLTINVPQEGGIDGEEYDDTVRIVEALLQAGATVDAVDHWGETPLHDAATCKHSECMLRLINAGANVNITADMGLTPLDKAFSGYDESDPDYLSDTSKRRRIWPLLLRAGGVSHEYPLTSMMDNPGHDYISKVYYAGSFEKHAKAHRARLVATFVPKLRIPTDVVPLVVDFWAHVGFY